MTPQMKNPSGRAGARNLTAINSSANYTTSEDNLSLLLSQLTKVKPSGRGQYIACCPAHNDKSPSLAIRQTDDGKILLHCFAGCSIHEITQAIGLNPSDLFPRNEATYEPQTRSYFNEWQILAALRHDALVVLIAARWMLTGKALPESDTEFLSKAVIRINEAISYSRRVK